MKINLTFGPVPSRRLGKSLGVNNIPPKICSYSCKYCQLGLTDTMQANRQPFYPPEEIADQVRKKILSLSNADFPDYISIIPDGEPTLDINLGELIDRLGSFGLPVAIFTNSSLMNDREVRQALNRADFVSLKVDAVDDASWKKINRPHKELRLEPILEGIREFAGSYTGILVTETMMIRFINDTYAELEAVASFLQEIDPEQAYIALPTRPPAVKGTNAADETSVMLAYKIFRGHYLNTELLTGYEGNDFASSGNFRKDVLSITAVHPMRREAIMKLMEMTNSTEENLEALVENGMLKKVNFNHEEFYLRKFKNLSTG